VRFTRNRNGFIMLTRNVTIYVASEDSVGDAPDRFVLVANITGVDCEFIKEMENKK
jgi:hypothetical protein